MVRKAREIDPGSFARELAGACDRARGGWEVEDQVRVVPAYFPGLNRAIVSGAEGTVGGWPLATTGIVRGKEGGGKSTFIAGLVRSFQAAGGTCYYVDAEFALDLSWFWRLGVKRDSFVLVGRVPGAGEKKPPPLSYEQAVLEVDGVLVRYAEAAQKRKMGPLLVVIDSLTKLVPAKAAARLLKEGDFKKSQLSRDQAQANTTWVKALGPRIADYDVSILFVVHDMAGEPDFRGRETRKPKGGSGIRYDASVIVDLGFAGRAYDGADPRGDDGDNERDTRPVAAKKHRFAIEKTKIGPQVFGLGTTGEFFVSTGAGVSPLGFDRPRELCNEAGRRGLCGLEWKWGFSPTLGTRIEIDKKSHPLKRLYEDRELLTRLEQVLR